MYSYIIRRLLLGVGVLILVTIMIFCLMHMLPGDPLVIYLGTAVYVVTPEMLEEARHEYGLDKPLVMQYFDWLGGILQGDMGRSIHYQKDVTTLLADRVPKTLEISIIALVIATFFGILFGTICAIRRGKWADTLFSVLANLGITVPNFWLGIMLIYVLALKLGWLPTYGYTSPLDDLWLHIKKLVMPVFCLGIPCIAGLTRQTRSSMLEVTRQDYIRTAWAKGLRERVIVLRHIIKNGLIPVVTTLGMYIGFLIGGAVLIETVFSIPGLGTLMRDAVLAVDYQVVQGAVLVMAVIIVITNLVVDITYGWIDPRIRYD